MTSRPNPFVRFDEHYQKVRSGTGHLLHKAWRAIASQADVTVQFSICGTATTRARAFDLEEQLVDELGTIAPGGLNVIAGGMKGIREMWRLGLMSRAENPTDFMPGSSHIVGKQTVSHLGPLPHGPYTKSAQAMLHAYHLGFSLLGWNESR